MKFKLDENLPAELADLLRIAGHEVATVVQEGLKGTTDRNLLDVCRSEARVLVTLDLDFSDIQVYPPRELHGIIVVRVRRQDTKYLLRTFQQIIQLLEKERLENRLWIVEETRVRIHGEPDV